MTPAEGILIDTFLLERAKLALAANPLERRPGHEP